MIMHKVKKNGSILDRRSSRVYIFQMFLYSIKKKSVATWCLFVMSAFNHYLPARGSMQSLNVQECSNTQLRNLLTFVNLCVCSEF